MYKSNTYRDGDTLITVTLETKSAVIDYADILDATEVVPDYDHGETPWDSCDGFKHEAVRVRDLDHADAKKMQGYCWHDGDREHVVITLPKGEDWGTFDYWRERGASKQFAAEKVAENRRQTIKTLREWYQYGWQWYGVKCEFEGEHESVWGIDDEDYAEKYVRDEIASQMAYELMKKGYTVVNLPVDTEKKLTAHREYSRSMTAEQWRAEFKRNVTL